MSRVPPAGIWAPAVTLFNPDTDQLQLDEQEQFYAYLASTGLAGLVILGTNAETFLLTREERKALIRTARRAVGPLYPLMAGVGGHSTHQTLEYIADAAQAGANYALVLPPAYFGAATTPQVLDNFFDQVAAESSLPIVIYNFPGVCNGIDLDSTFITNVASRHPDKVVGVKLTCGSVAKITRLAATFTKESFAVFGGQSDFLIGGLACGSSGCIAAFGNVFPRTLVRIYELYQQGKMEDAMTLHRIASLGEQSVKGGIASVKYAAALHSATYAGIVNATELMKPRRPYVEPTEALKERITLGLGDLANIEQRWPLKKSP